jgi:hypothetical protein
VAAGAGERGMSDVPCQCRILNTASPAGKLKNWKYEKLTSRPATRPTRISDFQDFRFSPASSFTLPGRGQF